MKHNYDEPEDNFLRHMRETFENHEVPYNPADWEKLRRRIPKGSAHLPERSGLSRQLWAYSMILVLLAVSWVTLSKFDFVSEKQSQTSSTRIVESTAPIPKDGLHTRTEVPAHLQDPASTKDKAHSLSAKRQSSSAVQRMASNYQKVEVVISTAQGARAENSTFTAKENIAAPTENSSLHKAEYAHTEATLPTIAFSPKLIHLSEESTLAETAAPTVNSAPTSPEVPLVLAGRLGMAQQYGGTKSHSENTLDVGVEAAIPLRGRWRLQSGVVLNNHQYSLQPKGAEAQQIHVAEDIYDIPETTPTAIRRNISTLSIPLSVNYTAMQRDGIGVHIHGGLWSTALIQEVQAGQIEQITITPQASNTPDVQVKRANASWERRGLQSFRPMSHVGVGVDVSKKMSNQTALALGGFARLPLRQGSAELPALTTVGLSMKLLFLTR